MTLQKMMRNRKQLIRYISDLLLIPKMGNWQLEIAKMAIYMAFPVTSFYVYHQVRWKKFYKILTGKVFRWTGFKMS